MAFLRLTGVPARLLSPALCSTAFSLPRAPHYNVENGDLGGLFQHCNVGGGGDIAPYAQGYLDFQNCNFGGGERKTRYYKGLEKKTAQQPLRRTRKCMWIFNIVIWGGVKGKRGTTKDFRKKPSERPTNRKTAMILRNE